MTAKDMIRSNYSMSDRIVNAYLEDLTDADLTLIPIEGMNPIAWQVGHLIASEAGMLNQLAPGSSPTLPDGFVETYDPANASKTQTFHTKDELLSLWKTQREATLKVLDATDEAKLDAESGVSYAPTVGDLLNMLGSHTLMHVGQWVAVRRKLGKKIAI